MPLFSTTLLCLSLLVKRKQVDFINLIFNSELVIPCCSRMESVPWPRRSSEFFTLFPTCARFRQKDPHPAVTLETDLPTL